MAFSDHGNSGSEYIYRNYIFVKLIQHFVVFPLAAPTTAPEIVQAFNTSDRSIFVQWTPPLEPVPGIIRGYRIFHQNLNLSLSPIEETSVDANTLSYDITSLEPYTEYLINILAFTVADGPKSASKSIYTDKKVLPRKSYNSCS